MQMILFITDESPTALLERPRKTVQSVVRHASMMMIDRPAPERPVARKPLPPRMPSVLPEPVMMDPEEEIERWDGLY